MHSTPHIAALSAATSAPVLVAALGARSATAALTGLAACSLAVTAGNELQLMPAGDFRGFDGRPEDAPHWHIDAALAEVLINAAAARKNPYVIDYEHQTLRAQTNGQPAPAAGWFRKLEWREGVGLFAVDVEWTERAKEMIAAGEYRYISPVIGYDKEGNVVSLFMAAITNNPAIHGMEEVLLAAATQLFASPRTTSLTQEKSMDELLEQLRWLLNLPVGSTAEDILAQLQKLTQAIRDGMGGEATAAASFDLIAHIQTQREQIASLSGATPDPSKFVAIGLVQDLQSQVAQLTGELNKTRIDNLVSGAIAAGKLLPSMESWAREFGAKDLAALTAYIEKAPPVVHLNGTQTGGKAPANQGGSLTPNQAALCAAMGISQEDFLKTQQAEQA